MTASDGARGAEHAWRGLSRCGGRVAGAALRVGDGAGLGEAQLLERFLVLGDEAAFEAILQRHGPMVLGVCRRVLDDPHDIADAFQATFLVLVKKGRSIRDRDALGTWLYGVARRVAVRARVERPTATRPRAARRRRGATDRGYRVGSGRDRTGWSMQELRSTIDEELERLPATLPRPADPLRPGGPDATSRRRRGSAARSGRSRAGWRGAASGSGRGWSGAGSRPQRRLLASTSRRRVRQVPSPSSF